MVGVGVAAMLLLTLALAKLEPAAREVDRATLIIDSVSRGLLVRNVRAPGTLVPERQVFVTALTGGRVEQLPLRPGVQVDPSTVIAVLTNPDVQMQALDAQRGLGAAEAQLITLRSSLEQQRLAQQSSIAQAETQYKEAERQAAAFTALAAHDPPLAAANEVQQRRETADELKARVDNERARLRVLEESMDAQLDHQRRQIEQQRAIVRFNEEREASMTVRAGESGVLQELPLDFGQYVQAGAMLARIAQPNNLKAVLRVPENQAKDMVVGLKAEIDTRNGVVPGHVMRVDPIAQGGTVTVEVALDGPLPDGARPDMSVDGVIEIERLENVLQVSRPGYGQPESAIGIFKLDPDGEHATRVTVQLGRASVSSIEIRGGLAVGDRVIVSDMSQYDDNERVRIK